MSTLTVRRAVVLVFLVATVAAAAGIGVRATFGAHVAVDEVQYLLSALSVAEDGNLDISDEWAEQRWADFADTEPPVQTDVLSGGRELSPHDPLLPVLLALPMGALGWVGAKLALALLAGLLAASTLWLAVRRFAIPLPLATVGVGLASASAPLAVYGQQVYPELAAALAVVLAVAALTAPSSSRGPMLLLGAAVTVLPWLSVKYVPVAASLAVLAGYRWWRTGHRRAVGWLSVGLLLMGATYLAVHRAVWGGWTVYASGDHFRESGEFGVIGFHPSYVGRALRLVGLLADRGYGLVPWQPGWLLLGPALGAAVGLAWLARPGRTTEPPDHADAVDRTAAAASGWHTAVLAWPLLAGWLVATFVAVTMSGFWWPGRQLVVVLPLALLVILRWLAGVGPAARRVALGLGVLGVWSYACLLVDGYQREITWVSGFQRVDDPVYALLRPLLPDYGGQFWLRHVLWLIALAVLAWAGWRAATRRARPAPSPTLPPKISTTTGR
ncbi:MAG TPA: hypothetical protein VHO00_04535 [Actinomycetes bacterium]|jgi:hypothetical protein|nr:hypothetical protein [Actinomycetes bacterium]